MPATFSKYLTSQRGGEQLLDSDGFIYSRKKCKDSSSSTFWRCCKYSVSSVKCPTTCRLYLSDNALTFSAKTHNHHPPKAEEERREVLAGLKRKAVDQQLSVTQNIVSEAIAYSSKEANQALPTTSSMGRVIQRARAVSSGSATYTEAKTADEFVLPTTCSKTKRGECFVLFDGMTDANVRIIIFSTENNVKLLIKYPNWICDGTFYVCPKIFAQSYTIHSVIGGKCVPLLYALTGDQKCPTYCHILEVLKYFVEEKMGLVMPTGSVLVDFEKAVMNAFKSVLPGWELKNCFFHICQSVQKRIQEKFKVKYVADKYFARAARLVVFMAFVPICDIEDIFYELTYYIQSTYPMLMTIVDYFEKTYLGLNVVHQDERATARFPPEYWNYYDRVISDCDFPRTSNMVEGFHRGFKTRVHRPKPSVHEYGLAIIAQQSITDFHADRVEVGVTPSKRRRVSNEVLQTLCMSYQGFDNKLEYLYAVAKYFGNDPES